MPAATAETLDSVFPDVMQKFAFSFGENCSKSELEAPAQGFVARVNFKGREQGETLLVIPAEMGVELAANIMGLEPDSEEAQACATDSICELANLVCGNLLQACAGSTPVFDLSAPEVAPLTPALWSELMGDDEVRPFLVDGVHPVLLKFRIQ